MDGVDQLNNILIIGMTNRLDMIDEALLRPGRLEVHMEISLPDEKGRLQILNIHTMKMRTNGIMDHDVDLLELAQQTKNFSGAELSGLVKSATSFAFSRHVKVGTMAGISEDVENLRVNRGDFLSALDEVTPAFGVSKEELEQVVQNGIIHYDKVVDDILRSGQLFVDQVRVSTRTPLVSLLLHGPPGSGKTALAATIARASEYPFMKLVSPDDMVGFSEAQKVAAISKVFADSYKSPLSVIVVDSLERLLGKLRLLLTQRRSYLTVLRRLHAHWPSLLQRCLADSAGSLLQASAKGPSPARHRHELSPSYPDRPRPLGELRLRDPRATRVEPTLAQHHPRRGRPGHEPARARADDGHAPAGRLRRQR